MNNYTELLKRLRWTAANDDDVFDADTATLAANAIETITAALAEERHRHDRLQGWDRGVTDQPIKKDAGKLELDLVPMQIVRDICEVRMYGTRKYGDPENWKRVELRRYVNALLRHTLAFAEDIHSVDEESGIPHYKHMECNLAFISEFMRDDHALEDT